MKLAGKILKEYSFTVTCAACMKTKKHMGELIIDRKTALYKNSSRIMVTFFDDGFTIRNDLWLCKDCAIEYDKNDKFVLESIERNIDIEFS